MKLTQIAKTSLTDNGQRTEFFANINFWVQLGTLVAQSLLATPIMRRFGLSTALIILPGIYFAAFVGRSFSESLIIMAAIDISTRIGAYGIAVPAREVLFTIVSRDAKYKAKNVIDTVVFRGFDVIASFANIVASFAALVTVGWLVLSWRLGKVYQELSASRESSPG